MGDGNGNGLLRGALENAIAEGGGGLTDYTVLAVQRDPFRLDTPANHGMSQWLAGHVAHYLDPEATIHLRGLHYLLASAEVLLPNGKPYINDDATWVWLNEKAAKAVRWLGYLPFDRIVDARNAAPVIQEFAERDPWPFITTGVEVEIPDVSEMKPTVNVLDFRGVQPYHLVIFGEKTSLEPVLGDVARLRHADLYLPSGEISDTLLYRMARTGAEDGRPMIVLAFSDSDPSGWQMPVSIAAKLQALKVIEFTDLEFEVHRVALTPEQVKQHGLPSTPLKDTEKRADKWTDATGTEQTEIDALAALQPDLLRRMALDAIKPFFDRSLERRVAEARAEWLAAAQAALDEQVNDEKLADLREQATEKLAGVQDQIEALNEAMRAEADGFDLPEVVIPGPEPYGKPFPRPLVSSAWNFADQRKALIASKSYSDNNHER
jgi:hypothetical protein